MADLVYSRRFVALVNLLDIQMPIIRKLWLSDHYC